MRRASTSSALATVAGVPTGRALIAVDDAAENSIVVVAGANARVPLGPMPAAGVVLAQLEIDPAVVAAALRAGRRQGATTILNPAPADACPPELLRLCDVVVPNEHEVAVLGGEAAVRAAGAATLVVTRGAAGVDLVTAAGIASVPSFSVDAVDTTGAGDAFCGALSARLAAGVDVADALAYAAAAGALATTRAGAAPSFARHAEIDALVATGTRAAVVAPRPPDPDVVGGAAQTARAYLAALSSGEPERVAALVTGDFVDDHASALGSGCVGREEYRRRLPGFMASFPGLTYEVDRLVADGPCVAASYRMRAERDGAPVDIRGVMVIETRGPLVARRTDYWDGLTLLHQIGQDPTAP